MHIEDTLRLDFDDVLIRPKRSDLISRKEVDLSRSFVLKHGGEISGVPIIAANMDTIGTIPMLHAMRGNDMFCALHKFHNPETINSLGVEKYSSFISVGMNKDASDYLERAVSNPLGVNLCLDVANGYTNSFVDFVKSVRKRFPRANIMAGNVVTSEMTEALIFAGADVVKVGVGPGSACSTRKVTGVGYPQLSAIIECADAAHGIGGLVCADGGCRTPGDIAKAFGAGADFVMLGGMLAGHNECENLVRGEDGDLYVKFRGMSSKEAMTDNYGGIESHRASEGKEVLIPHRGPVADTLQEIAGGLRSACTYVGASKLKELSKRTTFVRVNNQYNKVFGE